MRKVSQKTIKHQLKEVILCIDPWLYNLCFTRQHGYLLNPLSSPLPSITHIKVFRCDKWCQGKWVKVK